MIARLGLPNRRPLGKAHGGSTLCSPGTHSLAVWALILPKRGQSSAWFSAAQRAPSAVGEDGALPAAGTALSGGCSALRGAGPVHTQQDKGQTSLSSSHLGAPNPTTSPYVWVRALGGAASPLHGVSMLGVSLGLCGRVWDEQGTASTASFSFHHEDRSETKGLVELLANPIHHDPTKMAQTPFLAHAIVS